MNGARIRHEETPIGRIAAAARLVVENTTAEALRQDARLTALGVPFAPTTRCPDYADFRDGILLYLTRELLVAKREEAMLANYPGAAARIGALTWSLAEIEEKIHAQLEHEKERNR